MARKVLVLDDRFVWFLSVSNVRKIWYGCFWTQDVRFLKVQDVRYLCSVFKRTRSSVCLVIDVRKCRFSIKKFDFFLNVQIH